jgi:hypothetical protein
MVYGLFVRSCQIEIFGGLLKKAVFTKIVVFGYNPWISAAGTCFPRGGMGASSALPAGSPISLYFPQDIE